MVSDKHILIRSGKGVVGFIHDNQTRPKTILFQVPNVSCEPLDGQHPYPHLCRQFIILLTIIQSKAVERPFHLLHQFLTMRNQPYLSLGISLQEPSHHNRHHVGLTSPRRHLHHHRTPHIHPFSLLIIENRVKDCSGKHLSDVLQHLLLIIKKPDFFHTIDSKSFLGIP